MKKIIATSILLVIAYVANAQTGSITGKITDSSGKRPLPLTTITVFRAQDTALVTYRLANDLGEFRILGLPLNVPLRLLATYSGYEACRREFIVISERPDIALGTLSLVNTSKQLDEVIVIAERPPVIFKKDTIEFNTSAFKTLPNALVADLLKKMPGMQMDVNGNITYNARPVNRILVDGKRFFGDDTKMVTQNLPSSFIEKVQVLDDKEEIAQNNDGDLSKVGKVINLMLKKDVKKGWFGKVFAGAGTGDRVESGGMANIFRDTLQVSLIGFSNNVNRTSFSIKDVASIGGFERSGISSMSTSATGGIGVNGINFGGLRPGISTTSGAGINFNHAPTKAFSFFGQYFLGYSENNISQETNVLSFIGDTSINTRSSSRGINTSLSHTAAIGFNWKPDTITTTSFKMNYLYARYDGQTPSSIFVDNNKLGVLSCAVGTLLNNSSSNNFNISSSYTRRSKRSLGRNFSISQYLSYNSSPNYSTTESANQYYYPASFNQEFDQLRLTKSPSTTLSSNASYSDILNKKFTIRLNGRLEYSKQHNEVFTYGKTSVTNQYDSLNYSRSNAQVREQMTWVNGATISYSIKKIIINASVNWQQLWVNDEYGVGRIYGSKRKYSNLLPALSVFWKRYSLNISQSVSAPYVGYLSPVADNSNPYNIIYGNADLLPAKKTSFYLTGTSSTPKSNVNLNIYLGGSWEENAITQSVVLADNGIKISTPVNVNGVSSLYGNVRLSKQYKTQNKLILTLDAMANMNVENRPVYFNGEQSEATAISVYPMLGVSFNWKDLVEFSPRYSPVFSNAVYSNSRFPSVKMTTQNVYTELIVRIPRKVIWESYLTYRFNSEVAPGLPRENVYWNAAVSLLAMKDDKGQFKFSVYDILSRYNSYYRYISANTITDNRSNVLQRYFMLSFIYNVRPSGASRQKVGGKQNLFLF